MKKLRYVSCIFHGVCHCIAFLSVTLNFLRVCADPRYGPSPTMEVDSLEVARLAHTKTLFTTMRTHVRMLQNRSMAENCSCDMGRHGEGLPKIEQIDRERNMQLQTDRVMAAMTLGSVAFQMSLFYLINHRDFDMRRYAYGIIGQTISIFCSVLTFSALYELLLEHLHRMSHRMQRLAFPALGLFFFVVMELIVMFASRVRGEKAQNHPTVHGRKLNMATHVLNAKTFGAAAAQMCAAAAVRGFGHVQFLAYEPLRDITSVILVAPAAFMGLFLVSMILVPIRRAIILYDGVVDDTEITWVTVSEDCENEVMAITTGFLCAVVARVLITDSLPYLLLRGMEHRRDLEEARKPDIALLLLLGLFCGFICIFINYWLFGVLKSGVCRATLRSSISARLVRLGVLSVSMVFAWCIVFGNHLFALTLAIFEEGLPLRLYLALFQSLASFSIIWLLDMFADLPCTGPAFGKAIAMLIEALGVGIGLCWEHAFHTCVDICVEFMVEDDTLFWASKDPKVWALCLSGAIVATVLPAYRFFIVPGMYLLIEEHEQQLEDKEEKYRRQTRVQNARMSEEVFLFSRSSSMLELAQQ